MKVILWDYNGTRLRGGIVRLRANGDLPRRRKPIRALEVYLTNPDERRYHWRRVRFSDGRELGEPIFPNPEHLTPEEFAEDFRLVAADNAIAAAWMLERASPEQTLTIRRTDLLPLLAHPHETQRVIAIRALARVGEEGTPGAEGDK